MYMSACADRARLLDLANNSFAPNNSSYRAYGSSIDPSRGFFAGGVVRAVVSAARGVFAFASLDVSPSNDRLARASGITTLSVSLVVASRPFDPRSHALPSPLPFSRALSRAAAAPSASSSGSNAYTSPGSRAIPFVAAPTADAIAAASIVISHVTPRPRVVVVVDMTRHPNASRARARVRARMNE
jgi:hypothetical protein